MSGSPDDPETKPTQTQEPDGPPSDTGGADARAGGRPVEPQPPAPQCPVCGAALSGRHCKLVCLNCGYTEDCSDLFAG
jgi:hypothetical protein